MIVVGFLRDFVQHDLHSDQLLPWVRTIMHLRQAKSRSKLISWWWYSDGWMDREFVREMRAYYKSFINPGRSAFGSFFFDAINRIER